MSKDLHKMRMTNIENGWRPLVLCFKRQGWDWQAGGLSPDVSIHFCLSHRQALRMQLGAAGCNRVRGLLAFCVTTCNLRTADWTPTFRALAQSEASRAEAEAAEKRRWSFLEVDTARDEEVNEAGQAVQVSKSHFRLRGLYSWPSLGEPSVEHCSDWRACSVCVVPSRVCRCAYKSHPVSLHCQAGMPNVRMQRMRPQKGSWRIMQALWSRMATPCVTAYRCSTARPAGW